MNAEVIAQHTKAWPKCQGRTVRNTRYHRCREEGESVSGWCTGPSVNYGIITHGANAGTKMLLHTPVPIVCDKERKTQIKMWLVCNSRYYHARDTTTLCSLFAGRRAVPSKQSVPAIATTTPSRAVFLPRTVKKRFHNSNSKLFRCPSFCSIRFNSTS